MSLRKSLLLSLVCFTLDTANIFANCPVHCSSGGVAAVTISGNGDSNSCSWANAVNCVNVGASVIDLRVNNTNLLTVTSPDFRNSCSVISSIAGGTGLSTSGGAHLVRIHSNIHVVIGPATSPTGIWFSSSGGTPIGRVDIDLGHLELGPFLPTQQVLQPARNFIFIIMEC